MIDVDVINKRANKRMEIMIDEPNTTATPVVETNALVEAPVEKKKRAPRGSKIKPQAVTSGSSTAVKTRKPGQKNVKQPVVPTAAVATTIKATPVNRGPKAASKLQKVSVVAADAFADLIRLEEENKTLRAALAAKLRAENSELRKRLGS